MSATAKIPVRCQPGAINENVNSHTGEQAGLIFGPERGFNVARALVGTESTCATFTEVEIKLMPGLYMRTLVIVEYERLPDCGEDVAAAWDEALAADRPVLFEAITDPEVPPTAAAHPLPAGAEAGQGPGRRPAQRADHPRVGQGQGRGVPAPLSRIDDAVRVAPGGVSPGTRRSRRPR